MEKQNTVIEMKHIVKDFNGFKANNDINLKLHQGEILALLGENGAGKSTLMSILSGLLEPTSGEIIVNGQRVTIDNPSAAKKLGIGMVHQHFMLAHSFTVLENSDNGACVKSQEHFRITVPLIGFLASLFPSFLAISSPL